MAPIPFMARGPTHDQGPVAVAPYNYTWQLTERRRINGVAWPRRHRREEFARIDRIRESKVAGVRGGSGGSLPSIGAIMKNHMYAYV